MVRMFATVPSWNHPRDRRRLSICSSKTCRCAGGPGLVRDLLKVHISEGISLSRVEKICDHKIKERNIRYLSDLSLITIDNDRLFVNASGRLVLNQIINKLTEDTFY